MYAGKTLKILIIGSGGREHALAWRLAASPSVTHLYASPGNPGIAQVAQLFPASDYLALAEHLAVDLTVIGPEAPLVAGLVDQFRARQMRVVGPTADNARLEGSKVFSKNYMLSLGVPTAASRTVTNHADALAAISHTQFPLVLKTDGLAAGKGVVIASSTQEALNALEVLPYPLIIEEFLHGEEVSFIALCDGKNAVSLEPSQDHKRALDDDQGPNTGGMGAFSDSRILSPADTTRIMDTIINPIVETTGFTGFLYAGLMMTPDGPRVLEFNVRLGDPETQALMMRLESDWGAALMASADGSLSSNHLRWSTDPATCVVLASAGYPGPYKTDHVITGLDRVSDAQVFQAGTRSTPDALLTAGGRVLGVTARGSNLRHSIERAYTAAAQIHFDGMQYRKDIGRKGLARLQ